jgi:putative Mg2+ transporter-C (MgtC) family protein
MSLDHLLMDQMPIDPTWIDIVIRIMAALIAGALIGLNRERGGHTAGFRTCILVSLAACVSMIQANHLLSTSVETNGSMDILRFPLGVLTGVGFIGGGAILRRGNIATGVTTAATLWLATVIGLCFGGGQIITGIGATILAWLVLSPFKRLDRQVTQTHKASIKIVTPAQVSIPDPTVGLNEFTASALFTGASRLDDKHQEVSFELRWSAKGGDETAADVYTKLARDFDLTLFKLHTTTR